MKKNHTRLLEIEDYLDGNHPEPQKFESDMKNIPQLSEEVSLQESIRKAFSDPRKNQLRAVLAEASVEYAAEVATPKNGIVVHFQNYFRQYMAAAAVLLLVVLGVKFLNTPKNVEQPNTDLSTIEQPIQPPVPASPQPEMPGAPTTDVAHNNGTTKKNKPLQQHKSTGTTPTENDHQVKVDVQYIPAELTRGSDGTAKLEIVADLILGKNYENLQSVEVRLVELRTSTQKFKENIMLREEKAIGFVKNNPPSKLLEVETSAPLQPGEYDVQILLPDGDIIFSGRTIVK